MNLFEREGEDEDCEERQYSAIIFEAYEMMVAENFCNLSSLVAFQHCVTTTQIERVMNFIGGLMQNIPPPDFLICKIGFRYYVKCDCDLFPLWQCEDLRSLFLLFFYRCILLDGNHGVLGRI
jgi:hypothetical protein